MKSEFRQIGFIGLGVMGEPMCRNLAVKSRIPVLAYDRDVAPVKRLESQGVRAAGSVQIATQSADVVFLSLPSGAKGVTQAAR